MSIIEKLSSMKDRAQEVDQRISNIEKQMQNANTRFANIDNVLKKISEIEIRMGDLTKKIDQKIINDEKRIQNIESEFKTKIATSLSDLNKFEGWFKEKERKHVEEEEKRNKKCEVFIKDTNAKVAANDDYIKDLDSQINSKLSKFVEETRKFENSSQNQEKIRQQLEAQMDNLLETIAKNQKEVQNKVETFSTQKDLSGLRSNLIKMDEVLKGTVKQMETQIAEFDSRLNKFVEYDTLHKHFGEIKVDLATTEGNFRKIVEDFKEELDEIKSEQSNYPKINELQEQHIDLMNKLKALEQKTDFDFDKILSEIQKLGSIFAKKSEFATLSKRIEAADTRKVKQMQTELEVLKEQIINTQNAIVELNSFIQEQLS